jgi:hypothetical protein
MLWQRNYSVPLFEKEGLGAILLDKSPIFKGGGELLTRQPLTL